MAQAVFERRNELGMSQEELSAKAGTKQPRISVVESASKLPSLELLTRIASALGMRLTVNFEQLPGE
nr:helix-turn-helix transcriptional regulator [Streptomyces noursei]